MNPEKYKSEMLRRMPDKAVVETTLSRARKQLEKPKSNIWKSIGAVGLSAAVLVGAFFGAGAVRSLFKDINTQTEETTEEIKEETPVINETPETEDKITATDSELAVTPLSNPKYTVKADTPDGKVSLDENTTVAEMLACGVSVNTEKGLLGVQYLCEALRKYKHYESFEYILGSTLDTENVYYYYKHDKELELVDGEYYGYMSTVNWVYDHRYGQSITQYNQPIDFADMRGTNGGGLIAITLRSHDMSRMAGILTTYDTYRVTGIDKELRKAMYYTDITERNDTGYPPFLNIIYNGNCPGKYRMNMFIEEIENGAEYAGIQFTDITTTDEYDERVYSIEYCDGVYSIFTMTDGLDGKFDTQYFEGYAVADNTVAFDNGTVRYTFPLSENVEADKEKYGDVTSDLFHSPYATGINVGKAARLVLEYDDTYIRELFKENARNSIVINEELSSGEYKAVALKNYSSYTYVSGVTEESVSLKLDPSKTDLGTNNKGDRYVLSSIAVYNYKDNDLYLRIKKHDGKDYLMLTDEEIDGIINNMEIFSCSTSDRLLTKVERIFTVDAIYTEQ